LKAAERTGKPTVWPSSFRQYELRTCTQGQIAVHAAASAYGSNITGDTTKTAAADGYYGCGCWLGLLQRAVPFAEAYRYELALYNGSTPKPATKRKFDAVKRAADAQC
jgi:hypothetical protein